MKSLLFIILLICRSENNGLKRFQDDANKDLNKFIDRMCSIYGISKPKPEIDYKEQEDLGIKRRLKYGRFICVEFVDKNFAEIYFKQWVRRAENETGFKKIYKEGINICLMKNYVIEEFKRYNKNCHDEQQIKREDLLYPPYFKKNKKTFIRVKCENDEVEIK